VAELEGRAGAAGMRLPAAAPAGPAALATPLPLTPPPLPTPAGATQARSAAAELTRGAVDVARGVWDGLRSGGRAPGAGPRSPGGGPQPAGGDTLAIHTLAERPGRIAPPANEAAGTIPVPPTTRGGLVAALVATLQLSIEVLVTLVRGIANTIQRGFRARRQRLAAREQRPFIVRCALFLLRAVFILALLIALGGIVTISIFLFEKGVP